jgi:hypothetical protein
MALGDESGKSPTGQECLIIWVGMKRHDRCHQSSLASTSNRRCSGVVEQCGVNLEPCVEEQDSLARTTLAPGNLSEGDEAIHDERIGA